MKGPVPLKKAAATTFRGGKPKPPKPPKPIERTPQEWADYWHGNGERPHGDARWIREGGWSGKR